MELVEETARVDPEAFSADTELLAHAVALAIDPPVRLPDAVSILPDSLPAEGIGALSAMDMVAEIALPKTSALSDPLAASRMGSPTPWITWAASLWSASRSENLLHKSTTPQVNQLQDRVMEWLSPVWGMRTGHLVPGATVANLTAIWAARDGAGATRIVTSESPAASIIKASRILSMPLVQLECDSQDRLSIDSLVDFARRDPEGLARSVVVLTAGTHNTGSIDPLGDAMKSIRNLGMEAAWWHVDASWAGPLALSKRHAYLLRGIERADSVSVSAHKLMFQPTESALVMFADENRSNDVLEFDGPDESTQIGILGSRADRSLPIALTFLAYGREGVASWIDAGVSAMMRVADALRERDDVEVFNSPTTGILLWAPLNCSVDDVVDRLGMLVTGIGIAEGKRWLRQVAANPLLDADELIGRIFEVLDEVASRSEAAG